MFFPTLIIFFPFTRIVKTIGSVIKLIDMFGVRKVIFNYKV